MNPTCPVSVLVRGVHRRCLFQAAVQALTWATLIVSVGLLIVAIIRVVQGFDVRWTWLGFGFPLILPLALGLWFWRRPSSDDAARLCDEFFALKDGIRSFQAFSGVADPTGLYALQADDTRTRAALCQVQHLPLPWPRRQMLLAISAVILVVSAGFIPEHASITRARKTAEQLMAETLALNTALKDALETLQEQAKQDETLAAILASEGMKNWVEDLKATGDLAQALRQYAQLEARLQEMLAKNDPKAQEEMMQRMGQALSDAPGQKALAEALQRKDAMAAAKELAKLSPQSSKDLAAQRQDLKRLQETASRMAEAAKANEKDKQDEKSGKENGKNSQANSKKDLAQSAKNLSNSVKKYDQNLSNCERQCQGGSPCDKKSLEECEKSCSECQGQLSEMGKNLQSIAQSRKAGNSLDALKQALAKSQGALRQGQSASQTLSQCMSKQPGGKQAGVGRDDRTRQGQSPNAMGALASLGGTPGGGPSEVTTESADSGSGPGNSSSRRVTKEHQRQVEDFLSRDDIPADLKDGVKTYFQTIHDVSKPEKKPE